jgi:tetratricopeptide (TPR) repeat protein
MRGVALVTGLLLAATAFADRPPLPSGSLRGGRSSPFVIGPSHLRDRHLPVANLEPLRRRAAIARGLDRVEVLDELTALLENQDAVDEELDRLFEETAAWYVVLLNEPALEESLHADELLVRGAKNVQETEPLLARQSLERMVAKYPRSPYLADARVMLAEMAERRKAYPEAMSHLRAVMGMPDKLFSTYARVRLGWVLSLAGDAKGAVAELAQVVIENEEPSLVEVALDLVAVPYAQVGRPELATALYERGDRSETAGRLRRLANEYSDKGKYEEAIIALRAAIAHDTDLTSICFDRADIAFATLSQDPRHRVDVALAFAELAEARKLAEEKCKLAADAALGQLRRVTTRDP